MQLILKREKKLNAAKEHFWVIALNTANRILNLELISIGSTNATIVKPMEVLSIPLQKRAVGIILVHNHPSGSLQPSEADKDVTDRLIQAGKLIHTPVLDHVIITENSYYSFKDSGLLDRLANSNKYVLPYELEEQYHKEAEEAIKKVKQEYKNKIKEGVKQGKIEVAKSLLKSGVDLEVIASSTGLSIKDIEKLD